MLGVRIFIHSLKQVFGNLGPALKITGLLYTAQFAISIAVGVSILSGVIAMQPGAQMMPQFPFGRVLLVILVSSFCSLWMAVAWHRFILKGEVPDTILPKFHGDRMLGYLGYSFVLGLIAAILGFILGFIGGAFASALVSISFWMAVGAMVLIVYLPIGVVLMRCSPILPATALGDGIQLGEAFDKTRGATLALVVLILCMIVPTMVIDLLLNQLPPSAVVVTIVSFVLGWVYWVVGVSILTTIYGHFVEGRALNA